MEQTKPSENEKCDKECIEIDNKLSTLSTGKCSTDQLICKTPLDTPVGATASPRSISDQFIERNSTTNAYNNAALAFAILQIALGSIISICGFFIYTHNMACGLWTGPIVTSSGILGAIICCKSQANHLLHTWNLILSLVSFALSQLSLVLSAIGLTRLDASLVKLLTIPQPFGDFLHLTAAMEKTIAQTLLIVVMVATGFACLVAAAAVYLEAKDSLRLWCCVSREKKREASLLGIADVNGKDTMLRTWLGKLQAPPVTGTVSTNATALYMVPTTMPTFKRVNGKQIAKPYIRTVLPSAMVPTLIPVHVMMPQPQHLVPILPTPPPPSYHAQVLPATPYYPYPAYTTLRPPPQLIVGRPPSNIYHQPIQLVQRRHTINNTNTSSVSRRDRQRTMDKQQQMVDMACVYTGLDRDIAEQYIQCCDSKKSTITSNSTVEST